MQSQPNSSSAVIQGVNWVTSAHIANPSLPAVANMSLGGDRRTGYQPPFDDPTGVDSAVSYSIDHGVTYVVSAPDANDDASFYYPADVDKALTIGSVDWTGSREPNTAYGNGIDLFAPGVRIVSALSGAYMLPAAGCPWSGGNTDFCIWGGTSMATPHVAGAVAMYLEGRTGTSLCNLYPIQGVAPSGGDASPCPDRVTRFIDANANLSKLNNNINGTVYDQYGNPVTVPSANRFLSTKAIPITPNPNPIKNQRFFVWQHYADFITTQPVPDENGLNYWTSNITGCGVIGGCPQYNPPPTGCGTGFNDNNTCTDGKRVDVSRAFWVSTHSSWFNGTYGLTNFNPSASSPCGGSASPTSATPNEKFLDEAYCAYLRRRPAHNDTTGFNGWLSDLNTYGIPASAAGVNHIISAFLLSTEYKQRFGQP